MFKMMHIEKLQRIFIQDKINLREIFDQEYKKLE